jgi:aminomethyltransferase
MPIPTPFHPRTAELCTSLLFKEWAGYHAVRSFGHSHEREYHAVRQSAGLLDVTPLHKYRIEGPAAADFLAHVLARDARRLKPGRVAYGCWCDERGHVVDDGTLTCWEPGRYRLTSAEPAFDWLVEHVRGFDARIHEESEEIAALALQGPRSRAILIDLLGGPSSPAAEDLAALPFFGALKTRAGELEPEITRTGYTGDLGYELWIPAADALELWDALMAAGEPHRMLPMGLDALDVTRLEAGFLLGGVDYVHARRAMLPRQASTPYELGLDWTVHLEREPFLGQDALRRAQARGPRQKLVGLVVDVTAIERLFDEAGLPPELQSAAWREDRPVLLGAQQVGYATSGVFSPTLKQGLALATVEAAHAAIGTELALEHTVEHRRKSVPARVAKLPFFDPERKRSR